ncbi:zf-HC2 domain-containing protein [Nonomuraea soli]|uniref:RNA polymerase sigma-70 factor (ECF subfamily) n=1 Tax=Nonomuraea soli TaxID=1032476 RepID=A0A7W0CKQ8_9ACTN|nr:zf-HC2 domain-containing protein [Nonomuraea soli]MBA2892745.1 RNA polymerase sigma-70 factor (ECF subfamily) [Nonomuraea soli]
MHPEVAAYVLGVLDDDETERFERHLDGCADCRREIQELQEVPLALDELKQQSSRVDD